MKPNIILTFDYEIFFGEKSGTFFKCIYEPVEEIRKIMNKNNIKGIFFVDILYYIRLLEFPEMFKESILMKEQIQNLIKDGHRVELHLHPHWLNADLNNGYWKFKYNKYRFNQLTFEEKEYIFEKGIEKLLEIGKEVKENYKILGFRAGGLCIQPFLDFKPYFLKYGLKYDSSVIKNKKIQSLGHNVDFSKTPNKEVYEFSNDINREEINGEFIEYKISSYSYNLLEKIINKIFKMFFLKKNKRYGDGEGMKLYKSNNIFDKLKTTMSNYSLENIIFKRIILKKLKNEKNKNIVFISHPKFMTKEGVLFIEELKMKEYTFNLFEIYDKE